jgi:D-beta-D-heptose 7-phosphate kinase/D-beta-D-heptose 1-phosphate adenosyltransferase
MNIPDFSDTGVLVLGDVMLDQYYYGKVSRISPEAPVPVIKVNSCVYGPGGAANVSNNIKSLGGRSYLVGASGGDENGLILSGLLKKLKIYSVLFKINRETITKLRIIGEHQQIARLDFEETSGGPALEETWSCISKMMDKVGAVIISDYAKGFCTEALCKRVIDRANKKELPAIIEPKGFNWDKYSGAFLVSPNLKELGEICGSEIKNEDTEIERCSRELLKKYTLRNLLVTRSDRGMTLICGEKAFHIRSEARDVFDVSGAGDTVIATLSLAIAGGMELIDAVKLANKAAGIVVGKSGTVPIEKGELLDSFINMEEGKIINTDRMKEYASALKKEGKTIVLTNGCFDILHRGHIEYLRKAKGMGDILVIGLNTDASVRLNKGGERPINNERDRAEILSSLEFVDYVVLFNDKTPVSLVRAIKPDILVKSGDYKVEEVAGRRYAGKTVILPYLEGYSTTGTIKKIKAGRTC